MSTSFLNSVESELSQNERELLGELVRALRNIRYGSVLLTVHDGRLVEIHKTEKIRMNGSKLKD